MAVTDIIGFSFFSILPGCLPDLLSLVTVDRFIFPIFSHTHTRTPPPPPTPSFGIDLVWLLTALLWFSEAGRDNDGREATKESFTESYSGLESHGIHRQVAHDGVDDDGNTNSSHEVSPSESLRCRGEGRRGVKESNGTKRRRKTEREERSDKMEGEEHVSSVARPWTYITRKRPTGRGERKKEREGSRKRTKCRVDGVLRIKNEG
ncbi:hypothetical protein ALC56_13261 [Trachymyrmex septentrionalis]|uniref:Uncharacterized protein n=1 Tax=Trachymyrmex septentrionalis TaxID=34720 RepID=A0A195EWZ5_9HYME|nr:hypothetical protein ALC56_13261 [Trachymyrmex septentrionalis]